MIVIPVSRSELAMNSADVTALKAHVAINVRNVEASLEFYRKLFGIEPCKVRKGYAKFDVSNPALNFTLNQVPFTGAGALSHLGIQVASTEDVLAIRRLGTSSPASCPRARPKPPIRCRQDRAPSVRPHAYSTT